MRNASIVLGTTIALALAAVSHAQRPAGITRRDDRHGAARGGRSSRRAGALQSGIRTSLRLAGPCGLPTGGSHAVSDQRHAARDGLGQRRMRDQQHSLRRFPDDDRLARLPRDGDGRRAGRNWWPGHGRQPAQGRRLGRSGEQACGVAAARQDRARSRGDHGPVLWRVPVARAGSRPARGHDRRVQLGRCRGTTPLSSPRCTVRCCSSTGTSGTS